MRLWFLKLTSIMSPFYLQFTSFLNRLWNRLYLQGVNIKESIIRLIRCNWSAQSVGNLLLRAFCSFNPVALSQWKGDFQSFSALPVVSNVWKHMRSQSVEGGGHRLSTELQESLTEDDAGADQSDATHDDGHHHSQNQGRWQLALRDGSRCGCRRVEK